MSNNEVLLLVAGGAVIFLLMERRNMQLPAGSGGGPVQSPYVPGVQASTPQNTGVAPPASGGGSGISGVIGAVGGIVDAGEQIWNTVSGWFS